MWRWTPVALLWLAVCVTASAQSSVPPAPAAAPVTWLIFIDDLHLDFRNTGRIRDALKTIAAKLIQDGDNFAIASSGPSSLAVGVTADRQELAVAITKTIGNALTFEDVIREPYGAVEARYRASTALSAAQTMLETASPTTGGATALLYISNGYSVDLLPDGPPVSPSRGRIVDVTRAQIRQQVETFTATAANAGIRIFAIDQHTALAGNPPDPAWTDHRDAMRDALRSISDGSGGFAILGGEFAQQLSRISEAMR